MGGGPLWVISSLADVTIRSRIIQLRVKSHKLSSLDSFAEAGSVLRNNFCHLINCDGDYSKTEEKRVGNMQIPLCKCRLLNHNNIHFYTQLVKFANETARVLLRIYAGLWRMNEGRQSAHSVHCLMSCYLFAEARWAGSRRVLMRVELKQLLLINFAFNGVVSSKGDKW